MRTNGVHLISHSMPELQRSHERAEEGLAAPFRICAACSIAYSLTWSVRL